MSAVPLIDSRVRRHLARARLHALSDAPYLATALTAMVFLQVDDLGTVGIDQRLRTYVDPVTVMTWSVEELAGVLQHEANHFLRSHHARAPLKRTLTEVWNVAADLEINDDLEAAGISLPAGALTPTRMNLEPNQTAEWYLERLRSDIDESKGSCCGSGATGLKMPWELADDEFGVSVGRARAIVDQIAQAIRDSPPGNVPGGLTRWANARVGDTPWPQILRSVLRSALARGTGQQDYSWSTPNRRYQGPVILPRLRGTPTTILCVIDTSGSMQQDDVDKALGEVVSVGKTMCVRKVYVASCDTRVTYHGDLKHLTSLELVGGGGTSLENALEVISTNRINPSVVVFLTDGFTEWSDSPPKELVRRHTIVVTPRGNPVGPDWSVSISV